jgi:microcompartment protein CcmK/EutM
VSLSNSARAQTGLGAGVAGAVILAVGVAMHVRRRSSQSMPRDESVVGVIDINEKTPLAAAEH